MTQEASSPCLCKVRGLLRTFQQKRKDLMPGTGHVRLEIDLDPGQVADIGRAEPCRLGQDQVADRLFVFEVVLPLPRHRTAQRSARAAAIAAEKRKKPTELAVPIMRVLGPLAEIDDDARRGSRSSQARRPARWSRSTSRVFSTGAVEQPGDHARIVEDVAVHQQHGRPLRRRSDCAQSETRLPSR